MANIWSGDFTGVTVGNDPKGTHEGTFVGSVVMNYDTSTATSLAGLTFADKVGRGLPGIPGGSVTFHNFTLTAETVDGVPGWHLTSTASGIFLSLTWTDTNPPDLASAVIVGTGGQVYDSLSSSTNHIGWTGVCFAAGTLIRTPRGDVPVETLKTGDLVLTAPGEMRPVKWMGHRDVDFRRNPNASPGRPIRIAAGAFGPSRPTQDLYLSAGHSVCVDLLGEVFIPIGYLVNGATVAEVEVDEISYWHVELDSHDILIANNLPAESYLAMGNRGAFEEKRGLLPAIMEGRDRTHTDFCRPVVTEGPVLHFVRERLLARAGEIGWTPSRDADLRLAIDGRTVRPIIEDGAAAFLFPASVRDVRLMSNAFSPAAFGSEDPRTLGVMLVSLAFGGGPGGEARQISLGDERLRDGVHQLEDHGGGPRRWTDGNLALDPRLWDGLSGVITVRVTYDTTTIRGWTAPAGISQKTASYRPKLHVVDGHA